MLTLLRGVQSKNTAVLPDLILSTWPTLNWTKKKITCFFFILDSSQFSIRLSSRVYPINQNKWKNKIVSRKKFLCLHLHREKKETSSQNATRGRMVSSVGFVLRVFASHRKDDVNEKSWEFSSSCMRGRFAFTVSDKSTKKDWTWRSIRAAPTRGPHQSAHCDHTAVSPSWFSFRPQPICSLPRNKYVCKFPGISLRIIVQLKKKNTWKIDGRKIHCF